MKQTRFSLFLIVAIVSVSCGGLSKQDQAEAYLAAASKFDAARSVLREQNENLPNTVEWATIQNHNDSMAKSMLALSTDLAAINWTAEFTGVANQLIDCEYDRYALWQKVATAPNIESAYAPSDSAYELYFECIEIAKQLRRDLGLPPTEFVYP